VAEMPLEMFEEPEWYLFPFGQANKLERRTGLLAAEHRCAEN
jgi:hypothetical protein